jgi:serine/threonine protein kinase
MLDCMSKRGRTEETPNVEKKRKGPPTVTINGIVYVKQQICDETIDLIKEKKPDGIPFPPTIETNLSYIVDCSIKDNHNPREAGASSVICRLPHEKLLRVTTNESTFDDELNGLIIQYCLSNSEYVCKVYEFGYLLDTVNGKKLHVYAILEYLPIHFNGHLYRDRSVKPQIKKLLEAIDFFYSNKVSHLDIKPQNIGFNYNGQLKIFDFGFAVINRGKSFFHQVCNFVRGDWNGTYDYTDPYYLSYCTSSNISDVYSAGVIIFNTFFHLERGWGDVQIVNNHWNSYICGPGNPLIKCSNWNTFFVRRDMTDHPDINTPEKLESLKTLLYGMLQPNPKFRITAEKALLHPWLNEHSSRTSSSARISTPIRTRISARKKTIKHRIMVTRSRIGTRGKSYTPKKRPKIR